MKIFIENGEGHIVTERMTPHWKKMGVTVQCYDTRGCDVHLAFVHLTRGSGLPTVLRLDSVYYDADTNYNARNSGISQAHAIADAIIYQSNSSKQMCERYLTPSKKSAKKFVIYNGVDKDWCGPHKEIAGDHIIVSAKWRRHKRLKETIDLFREYVKYFPKATLHIFGMLHDNVPVKHPNIIYYGHVDRKDFAYHHSIADFTIHLSKKDSCPNSVVEAIGAGLPVITTDACGGSTEMCQMTEGCIIVPGEDKSIEPCYPYRDSYNVISPKVQEGLLDAMIQVTKEKPRVKLPQVLTAEEQAVRYLEVFKSLK